MLKSLLYIFIALNFVSVQSLASVCKTKCSVMEISKTEQKEKSSDHQGCHSTEESNDNKNSESECGSICQADDLFKVDAESFNYSDTIIQTNAVSNPIEIVFLNPELFFAINTHDPPGHGFHLGLPIFIQKASFLI